VQLEEFTGDSTDNDKNPRFVTGKACEKRNDIRKNILVVQNRKQATEHIRKSGSHNDNTLIEPIFRKIYFAVVGGTSAVDGGREPSPVCERNEMLVS
jgi:hypothetical protein